MPEDSIHAAELAISIPSEDNDSELLLHCCRRPYRKRSVCGQDLSVVKIGTLDGE